MQNLTISDNGATIVNYSSQYHHESRVSNLSSRNSTLVWFSHITQPLPQHVTFRLKTPYLLHRVGIYLHGENNQNPKHLKIFLGNVKTSASSITKKYVAAGPTSTSTSTSSTTETDGQNTAKFKDSDIDWILVVDSELEHRAGDHLFDLKYPISSDSPVSSTVIGPVMSISDDSSLPKYSFIKYLITENFGGSGIFVSKCYAFGK